MELDQDTLDAINEAHQDANDFDGFHVKAFIRELAARGLCIRPLATPDLMAASKNAAATIGAIYQWLERVEKAGGATSLEGVASCNAMLKSLRKNADRTETLVMAPLRAAIESVGELREAPHA